MTEHEQHDPQPPVARYRLTMTITGNTLDEIEHELVVMTRGGFLLDSDGYKRDAWHSVGGTVTSIMEHVNPKMTPERYEAELEAWFEARKAARTR